MVCLQSFESVGMEANKIKLDTLALSFAAVFFVETVTNIILSISSFSPLIWIGFARIMQTCLILFIIFLRGGGLSSIGLEPSILISGVWRGVVWSFGFGVAAALVGAGLFTADFQPLGLIKTTLPVKKVEIILFFVVGGVVGPVAEEMFFRGIIYGFLKRWGIIPAIGISTLLFTLSHYFISGAFITQMLGGIVFALAYELEGCLLVPILIHILGNLAIFTLSLQL
ncbi:MAG TPA: CPBP family intramembrane metalloprotease [Methanosarcinaceae archaeon]|nr:CPBP family intramembrane metalloprotease [Methanosarcinaceae archaeon]